MERRISTLALALIATVAADNETTVTPHVTGPCSNTGNVTTTAPLSTTDAPQKDCDLILGPDCDYWEYFTPATGYCSEAVELEGYCCVNEVVWSKKRHWECNGGSCEPTAWTVETPHTFGQLYPCDDGNNHANCEN
jgi:hypothetical protein